MNSDSRFGVGPATPVRCALIAALALAALGLSAMAPDRADAARDIATVKDLRGVVIEVVCRRKSRLAPRGIVGADAPHAACRGSRDGRASFFPVRTVETRLRIDYVDSDGEGRAAVVRTQGSRAADVSVQYESTRAAVPVVSTYSQECRPAAFADTAVLPGRICAVYEPDGVVRTWLVQLVHKKVPDFGGDPDTQLPTVYVSTWLGPPETTGQPTWAHAGAPVTVAAFDLPPLGQQAFDGLPRLLAYPRWSKFSPGGYKGYLKGKHFPLLFGSLTYSGYGVYGPGDRFGSPTTDYGRNVYIDTLDSDYGDGWRRIMGVLTQPPNGTFCYELAKKGGSGGKTGISTKDRYRLTAIGPGLTPVVQVEVTGPGFAFGAPDYDPRTMKWGTGFSAEQAQALRDQAAMIGPNYRTKPKGKGSTDCGETLRQLPEAFFAPPPA